MGSEIDNFCKVEHLYKSFDKTEALKGVSFEVKKGEIFGLIGPDGAGKTTLFRILTSLLLPDRGKAEIGPLDVVNDYKKIRRSVGYMPQRFSLYQDLSVEENLSFFARIFGTTIEENYHLIRDIYQQIEPFKDRLARNLSGGMKQKLALSCALIHKPDFLVLDEPTTGVDAVSRKEFWEMLIQLKKSGLTILVATPYMDEANLCDRVALIQKGEMLSVNTPEELTKSYPDRLFAIKSANLYRLIEDLKQRPEIQTVFPFGEYLHITLRNPEYSEELNGMLEEKGHAKIVLKEISAGIEDCFMSLMMR